MEQPSSNAWRLASLGIQLVVCVLMGVGFGYWADKHFNTQPLWTIVGSVLGIVVGLYQLIEETSELQKRR